MAGENELGVADAFVMAKLSAAAGLTALLDDGADGIHNTEILQGYGLPAVVFAAIPDGDQHSQGSRNLVWVTYMVAGMAAQDAPLYAIADQIDLALHNVIGTQDGKLCRMWRVRPYTARETVDGKRFVQQGGLYRLAISG